MSVFLARTEQADAGMASVEDLITARVLDYAHATLHQSPFFTQLKQGVLALEDVRYVFRHYRLWRDQFHTWFGVCLVKSGSCEQAGVAQTVTALAQHVLEEMQDDHHDMYCQLLQELGLSEQAIAETAPSPATRRYSRSFLERFGLDRHTFFEAVVALSGRELFASLRNTYLLETLQQYGLGRPVWLALHEALELEHFHAALRPFVATRVQTAADIDHVMQLIQDEIDAHVAYWDALLTEAQHRRTPTESMSD